MLSTRNAMGALAAALMAGSTANASAQSAADAPASKTISAPPATGPSGKALTGKERLGDKSTDDQRLDNCKVPLEKQGTKERSGNCDHLKIGLFPGSASA